MSLYVDTVDTRVGTIRVGYRLNKLTSNCTVAYQLLVIANERC